MKASSGCWTPTRLQVEGRRKQHWLRPWRALAPLLVLSSISLVNTTDLSQSDVFASHNDQLEHEAGTLWSPYFEWELENPSYAGNPFDVAATVTFTHAGSGTSLTTPMFYAGGDVWRFRFTGTKLGEWSFVTSSEAQALDGRRGTLTVEPNADSNAHGFLTSKGNKFAVPVGNEGQVKGTLYNVYHKGDLEFIHQYPTEPNELRSKVAEAFDEVEKHGAGALFVIVANNWFEFGALAHDEHDSEDPDLTTFLVLESLIVQAHERGLHVHIWAWGDEDRRWTPIGMGGINGEPDRRLQRYIAARLGPLPGWTMGYGFDLHEWTSADSVRAWHGYLHENAGWPLMLTAREERRPQHNEFFDLGDARLDIYSKSIPGLYTGDFDLSLDSLYDEALVLLEEAPDLPNLQEDRWIHTRFDFFDMDNTRRTMWRYAMAGGVGAVWGTFWGDGEPRYPKPGQLRVHARFWDARFLLDMEPAQQLGDTYALKSATGDGVVFYKENADSLRLNLTYMVHELPAVAVDTTAETYEEIDLGLLSPGEHVWDAPYQSDWAVAVGTFSK